MLAAWWTIVTMVPPPPQNGVFQHHPSYWKVLIEAKVLIECWNSTMVPRMVALRRCLLRFTTAQGLAAQLADCAGSELRQGKGLARGGTIGGGDENTRGF